MELIRPLEPRVQPSLSDSLHLGSDQCSRRTGRGSLGTGYRESSTRNHLIPRIVRKKMTVS